MNTTKKVISKRYAINSSGQEDQSIATHFCPLNELKIKAINSTTETQEAIIEFLNYCASNLYATIIYTALDIILLCDSDTMLSRLVPKSRSP